MSTSTTQQFDGATIEEALSAAVATMGDDLEILDAQKVARRRRFGVRKQERFEVIAAPRTQSDDEFESVLRRMVDRVDDEERRTVDLRRPSNGGVDLADSDMSWWEEADFVVPEARPTGHGRADSSFVDVDLTDDLDVRSRRAERNRGPLPSEPIGGSSVFANASERVPSLPVAPLGATAPVAVMAPISVAPPTAPPMAPPVAPVSALRATTPNDGAVQWSLDALRALGLPPLVLERLAASSPTSDLEWISSLAEALKDLLDSIDVGRSSVELTGYGRQATIELIGGICRGMRAGHLVIDGVRIPATPLDLALGVRACLQG